MLSTKPKNPSHAGRMATRIRSTGAQGAVVDNQGDALKLSRLTVNVPETRRSVYASCHPGNLCRPFAGRLRSSCRCPLGPTLQMLVENPAPIRASRTVPAPPKRVVRATPCSRPSSTTADVVRTRFSAAAVDPANLQIHRLEVGTHAPPSPPAANLCATAHQISIPMHLGHCGSEPFFGSQEFLPLR